MQTNILICSNYSLNNLSSLVFGILTVQGFTIVQQHLHGCVYNPFTVFTKSTKLSVHINKNISSKLS